MLSFVSTWSVARHFVPSKCHFIWRLFSMGGKIHRMARWLLHYLCSRHLWMWQDSPIINLFFYHSFIIKWSKQYEKSHVAHQTMISLMTRRDLELGVEYPLSWLSSNERDTCWVLSSSPIAYGSGRPLTS